MIIWFFTYLKDISLFVFRCWKFYRVQSSACEYTCVHAHVLTRREFLILFFTVLVLCLSTLWVALLHIWVWTSWKGVLLCFKLLRVSICFYLTCGCEDHAWPMGSYTVPRGCGVLSAREICLAIFFFLQQLSYTSLLVWSHWTKYV